ncbi:recombination mediator RecR [Chitinivibrio alkaliphilus]|uniref:Recombination protein RecR n=1 Tax=Chitinivibrio alkaliphilus ACht1 TaxID=1313304 RepID=U7D5N4_9BACT|nr:recombination mediator RecR [Chitinivibrio alkaliphilus]ERP31283.1 recombination protein RecR [Chitinivibrio alkaliphilus ACht1]
MTDALQDLVHLLQRLPSVGEKSAWRMAMHLLEQKDTYGQELVHGVSRALESIGRCSRCNTWCEGDLCAVCASSRRNTRLLCLVEKPQDMWSLERESSFDGTYHVLGGVLSPMRGVLASHLFLDTLVERISLQGVEEVIIGLGGSSEAEITYHYIVTLLEPMEGLRISRFARGLSAGMDIDYADKRTLDTALSERRNIQRQGEYGDSEM